VVSHADAIGPSAEPEVSRPAAAAEPGVHQAATAAAELARATAAESEVPRAVAAASESEVPRAVAAVAAIWQLTLLVQVLVYLHAYRSPAVPVAVWTGMLLAALWLVPKARSGGLTRRQAVAAVAVALAAVITVGWDRRAHGAGGSVDWSVLGTGWLLALVALSRPAWEWICGAVLVFAAHAVFAIHVLGVTPLSLARLASTAYLLVVVLVVFAAMRPTWRTHARMAARRVRLASRSAAERAAVAAVREDRRERLALLEMEALPLLRGIADGTLDAADSGVREQCTKYAAALRRALTDRPPDAGDLLAELEPVMRAARARGLWIEIQVVGDPGRPARAVAGAVRTAVGLLVEALAPQPVTLTVLASGDDVELYLAFGRAPQATPDLSGLPGKMPGPAGWHATIDVDETGAGCLELRWSRGVVV
jgi:hypothetical protein